MKKVSIIISMILIILFSQVCNLNIVNANEKSVKLTKLEMKININSDGSVDIEEIWKASINNVSELSKTIKIDEEVSDIKVIDKTNGKNYELSYTSSEQESDISNSYYIEETSGEYKITWGTGLEDSSSNKVYEISYHVDNVITKYNDYAQIYWEFIEKDFSINIDKIIGTIILPEDLEDSEQVKTWVHADEMDSEIYMPKKNIIRFQIENYKIENSVDIRVIFPTRMIEETSNTYDEEIYTSAITEELKIEKKTTLKSELIENKENIILVAYISIVLALVIIYIEKSVKYIKQIKKLKRVEPKEKYKYFKKIPKKEATPGEAIYILEEPYNRFTNYFGRIFAANIIDLNLNGYLGIRIEAGQEKIYIRCKKITKRKIEILKKEQKEIYLFIKKIIKDQEEISIEDIKNYFLDNIEEKQKLIEKSQKEIEDGLIKEKILSSAEKEKNTEYKEKANIYYIMVLISILLRAIPLSIILLLNGVLCFKLMLRTNPLTQKGINEKEKWKGLKKYIKDFSKLDKETEQKEEVLEKIMMVYSVTFGINRRATKNFRNNIFNQNIIKSLIKVISTSI